MYKILVKSELDKKFAKLAKRNKKQFDIIMKKAKEASYNPHHYKNLRKPLQHWKRIHIDKHFVLTFSVDDNSKTITLEDYDHHDKIYNRRK
tara:strand:- start:88 stop:360 length:273 start_codon:yes stop_codon:yes gene_type:complete